MIIVSLDIFSGYANYSLEYLPRSLGNIINWTERNLNDQLDGFYVRHVVFLSRGRISLIFRNAHVINRKRLDRFSCACKWPVENVLKLYLDVSLLWLKVCEIFKRKKLLDCWNVDRNQINKNVCLICDHCAIIIVILKKKTNYLHRKRNKRFIWIFYLNQNWK